MTNRTHATDAQQEGGQSNSQAVELRWRIHEGEIPLRRRHLRSLQPLGLTEPLMGWIHERLEWALANMLDKNSEAVLVLKIDPANEVTVSLDPVRNTPVLHAENLLVKDGIIMGVDHEGEELEGSVWLEREGVLYASCDELVSATETLAFDLANTLKMPLEIKPQRLEAATSASIFHISNEFGFVRIQKNPQQDGHEERATKKMQECFAKLW